MSDLIEQQKASLQNSINYSEESLEISNKIMDNLETQHDALARINNITTKTNIKLVEAEETIEKMRGCFHFFKKKKKYPKLKKNKEINHQDQIQSARNISCINTNSVRPNTKKSDISDELDIISRNISAMKINALRISDEIDEQNLLIDNISYNMSTNVDLINKNNKKIEKI